MRTLAILLMLGSAAIAQPKYLPPGTMPPGTVQPPAQFLDLGLSQRDVIRVCLTYVMPDRDPSKAAAIAGLNAEVFDRRARTLPNFITYRRAVLLCITNDAPAEATAGHPNLKCEAEQTFIRMGGFYPPMLSPCAKR